MFDFVHKHKTLIQIVLAVIFLPFAFFGVDSYFRSVDLGADIGSVNGRPITQQEFAQALQERQRALVRLFTDLGWTDLPNLGTWWPWSERRAGRP